MRTFLKLAIFLFLAAIVSQGAYLGYLLSDTQKIRDFKIPEIEREGSEIRKRLQEYDMEAANMKREFPVAEPANWVQRIEDGLAKANVTILNQNTRPALQIRDTDAQSIVFSITVKAESLKQLFDAVSRLEKIDPAGAARVTRFSIPPRRSDDSSAGVGGS